MISVLTALFAMVALCSAAMYKDRILNPTLILMLSWAPAVTLSMMPVTFTEKSYWVLSAPVSPEVWLLLSGCLATYSVGALVGYKRAEAWSGNVKSFYDTRASDAAIWVGFLVGLSVGLFAYYRSGLAGVIAACPDEIVEMRKAFHIRHLSNLVLLMDVGAILLFARYLQRGSLVYIAPMVVTILLYGATLQKSKVVFVVAAGLFVILLYRERAIKLMVTNLRMAFAMVLALALVFVGLFASNNLRGVGRELSGARAACGSSPAAATVTPPNAATVIVPATPVTNIKSGLYEQVYIYSGAPAIKNLSATLTGTIASAAPTYGLITLRSLLWMFVDRRSLDPTQYLNGINNGTAVMYYWHDFGVPGAVVCSLIVGFMTALAFRWAAHGHIVWMVAGALGFHATFMSVFTDYFFELITVIMLGFALLLHFASLAWQSPRMPRFRHRDQQ